MKPTSSSPVAFSYVRFSHPDQAKGDSLRRQTEMAAVWCKKNGVSLDVSTTLHDLGKSAYTGSHRKNPDRHALAAFLKLVEQGKVPHGSFLVIENLDRLSREHIRPALTVLLNLIEAGVRVVQLKPVEQVFDDKVEPMQLMMAIMELSRGHGESKIKSVRVGAAWEERRRNVREEGEILTRRLPAWVEERNGELRPLPGPAAAIQRVYQLAAMGYGHARIVKRLEEEKVPAFGASGHWTRAYVGLLLEDRRVRGEFQPRRRDGTADGPTLLKYYPEVISEMEWNVVQAARRGRKLATAGRQGKYADLFARGLLRNARDGGTYTTATRTDGGKHSRVLINTLAAEGRAKCYAFPLPVFERTILGALAEIDPHEILNGDQGPDESLVLAGQMAAVEGRIAELEAELLKGGQVAALARVLRQLEEQKRGLAAELAEARQKAAHPLSESWGECQTLLETLDAASDPEDARLRLRSALRRMIDAIWLLVVPKGRDRLCAVQIWFADGKRCRSYLILHQPPKGNASARQEGRSWCRSFADVPGVDDLDLRRRKDAKQLERTLAAIDVDSANGG